MTELFAMILLARKGDSSDWTGPVLVALVFFGGIIWSLLKSLYERWQARKLARQLEQMQADRDAEAQRGAMRQGDRRTAEPEARAAPSAEPDEFERVVFEAPPPIRRRPAQPAGPAEPRQAEPVTPPVEIARGGAQRADAPEPLAKPVEPPPRPTPRPAPPPPKAPARPRPTAIPERGVSHLVHTEFGAFNPQEMEREQVFADLEQAEGAAGDAIAMLMGGRGLRSPRSTSLSFISGGSLFSASGSRQRSGLRMDMASVRQGIIYSEILQQPLALRDATGQGF